MARRSPTGGSARDGCYAGYVSFRPAADSDRAVVEAIWQEQNRLHAGLEPTIVATADPVMSEERFREILDDPLQEIAVAVEDGTIVGAALLIERHLQGELQGSALGRLRTGDLSARAAPRPGDRPTLHRLHRDVGP